MLQKIWHAWDQFFFATQSMLPVAIFRIVLGVNLFVMYAIRFRDWKFFFTDEGFVRSDQALEILPEFFRPVWAWYPATGSMTFVLSLVFLLALLCLTLGVGGRVTALISFVLHIAFMQRNFAIIYGADIIASFFLFGLIFTDNSRRLSLLGFWRARKVAPGRINELFASVGVRLIQIQICLIYGYTGLEKLKGPSWWEGTAVWAVIGNRQIMMFDTSWLKNIPLAIAVMTFSTILFEVYFPILVWIKGIRKWLLAAGVAIHGMIAITVGLVFFSTAMCSTYFLFADPEWLESLLAKIKAKLHLRHAN
jgi:hypothetical protein